MIGFFLFFPDCSSHQKTLHQRQLPPIIPSFFRLAFQGEAGALVLATTLYLEATLIIVRSRTAHETKVKAKLIARARVHHPHHHAGTFPLSYQESFRKSMAAAFGDRALSRKLSLSAPAVAAAAAVVLSGSTERLAAIIPAGRQQPRPQGVQEESQISSRIACVVAARRRI